MDIRISDRIKEIRIEKNIDQKTLAKAIGVAQSAISQWENGINEPKASYIVALSKYFNVSADFLLGIEE